jgi:2-phosphosulfolactate phosphatase
MIHEKTNSFKYKARGSCRSMGTESSIKTGRVPPGFRRIDRRGGDVIHSSMGKRRHGRGGIKRMRIIRKSCAEGAEEVSGVSVVIDVFRAFSCSPLLFHFGVKRVILEADPEKALALKEENPDFILMGEVDEVPLEGAEVGNSPSRIILRGEEYFHGKTVIHRTTAGVTGVVTALRSGTEVILGSFVMAGAIAAYLKGRKPDVVTLVAMGDRARAKAPEDEACADYLEHLLTGKPYDPVEVFKRVVFQQTAQKFIRGTKEYLPREDPIFCLQRDLFDLVLQAGVVDGRVEVSRIGSPDRSGE